MSQEFSMRISFLPVVIALLGWTTAHADPAALEPIPGSTGVLPAAPSTLPSQRATQLPDGRWLLTGGEIDAQTSNLIQVLSGAQTQAFSATLIQARSGHSATVLADGTVFIFGGTGPDGRLVQSSELIDPVHGTVTALPTTGLTARTQHSATLLSNGQVLIAGGSDGNGNALATAQLWDPRTGATVSQPSLQIARFAQEAALLVSGEGLLWGGQSAAGQSLNNGEIYNPSTQLFEGPVGENDSRVLSLSAARGQPPYVADTLPETDAVGVTLDSILGVRFSKPLPIAQLNAANIVLVGPAGAVAGSVSGAERGMLAFFRPSQELAPGTTYTLFISHLTDQDGRVLPSVSARFTTLRIHVTAVSAAPTHAASTIANQVVPTPKAQTTVAAAAPPPAPRQANPAPPALPPTPNKKPTPAPEIAEDWIPQAQNRHGAWRVLGLANDPPLSASATTMNALSAPPNQTAVAGRVLRLNGLPIAGVRVSAGARSTTTDTQGRFLLSGISAGALELKVDGTGVLSNGRHYTEHYLHESVTSGTTTVIAAPIYLPRVDPATEVSISSPADHEIVLIHPAVPGLEVHIPKGAVIRDQSGNVVSKVSITPIPVDRAPYPAPVPFSVYFTLQPGGAFVDGDPSKAIKIIYPNYLGLAPAALVDFWNYEPTAGGWQVYGHGKVSADGKQVIADESVGFRQIMTFGWAISANSGPAPTAGPTPNGCKAADPVDCATGLFSHTVTDMMVNDVIPISVTRMYRTNDTQPHAFGVGAALSYSMWLYMEPNNNQQEIDLVQGDGSRIQYFLTPGVNDIYRCSSSPTVFNGSTVSPDSVDTDTPPSFHVTLKDGSILRFNVSSPYQLMSITDRNGNVVTISAVNSQNETATAPPITQITSPNGRYIQFFYDSYNRIAQAVDNAGRSTSYAYNTGGQLASATDADGNTESYGYDPTTNNMNLVTDKRGNAEAKNTYDANGRVSQQTLADGSVWQFSYALNAQGGVTQTTVTDPRGYVRQHTFNASGYPTQTILAQGKPEQQTYTIVRDASNLPLSVTDTLGRQTLYGYDAVGDLTSVTALAGTASAVTYTMTYDQNYHQLTSMTDPLGHTTQATIGPVGNTVAVSDALGNQTAVAYNGMGLPTQVTDPLGHTTQFGFRGADLSSVTDPLSRTTWLARDSLGRLLGITDPLANATQYTHDAMDRLTSVINAIGGATNLTYDQNGNLLTVTDPRSVVQTYTYDTRNRRHTYQDPAGKVETDNYDGMSNLTSVVDRKSQTTSITYDGINRPTLITFQDNSTIAITWDGGNRPTQFVDSLNGTITRTYDLLDRLTQETSPQGTVSYQYDAAGRRETMTATGQAVVNYTFDADSRLTQVAQGTTVLAMGYDAASRRTSVTLPNGIVGTFGFDNASELTGITYMSGSTQVGTLTYGYDAGSRRTSVGGTLAGFVPPNYVASMTYWPVTTDCVPMCRDGSAYFHFTVRGDLL
jgi:YD repeat-containing protein